MNGVKTLWATIIHPRRVARQLAGERGIGRSLTVVIWFGAIFALALLWTHMARAYPLPAAQARVWSETGMVFAIRPYLNVAPEAYRLTLAIMAIPLVLAIWLLMAGTGRLLAIRWSGKGSFEQYLNLFGFSFFAVWGLTLIVDNVYNTFLHELVAPALPISPPALERAVVVYVPSVLGTMGITLAGVYNGLVAGELEHFSRVKAAIVGAATLFWPFVLSTMLLR